MADCDRQKGEKNTTYLTDLMLANKSCRQIIEFTFAVIVDRGFSRGSVRSFRCLGVAKVIRNGVPDTSDHLVGSSSSIIMRRRECL